LVQPVDCRLKKLRKNNEELRRDVERMKQVNEELKKKYAHSATGMHQQVEEFVRAIDDLQG